MMGSSGDSSSDAFSSVFSILALLADPKACEAKLRELDQKINDGKQILASATDYSRKADADRRVAENTLNDASNKLQIAEQVLNDSHALKAASDKKEEELSKREAALQQAQDQHRITVQRAQDDLNKKQGDLDARTKNVSASEADAKALADRIIADAKTQSASIITEAKANLDAAAKSRAEASSELEKASKLRIEYEARMKKLQALASGQ